MKTDARVKYTKMVLKKALLELLEHKPVNKITVKEVCERAGLNRATFYAHYTDCFDLLESIEEELFGQFERSMQNYVQSFDIAALVDGLYGIIQENEAVCRVLLFGRRSTELIHRMIVYAHDLSIASWRRTSSLFLWIHEHCSRMFAISSIYGFSPAAAHVLRKVCSCIRGEHEQMTTPVSRCSSMAARIMSCPLWEHI